MSGDRTIVLTETIRAEQLSTLHLGSIISIETNSGALIRDTLASVHAELTLDPAAMLARGLGSPYVKRTPSVYVEFDHISPHSDVNPAAVWPLPIVMRVFSIDPSSLVAIFHQVDVDEPEKGDAE